MYALISTYDDGAYDKDMYEVIDKLLDSVLTKYTVVFDDFNEKDEKKSAVMGKYEMEETN